MHRQFSLQISTTSQLGAHIHESTSSVQGAALGLYARQWAASSGRVLVGVVAKNGQKWTKQMRFITGLRTDLGMQRLTLPSWHGSHSLRPPPSQRLSLRDSPPTTSNHRILNHTFILVVILVLVLLVEGDTRQSRAPSRSLGRCRCSQHV